MREEQPAPGGGAALVHARERSAHQHQALVEDHVRLAERRLLLAATEHPDELPAALRGGVCAAGSGGAQAELPGLALVPPDRLRLRVALAAAQAEPAAPAEHGGEQLPRRAVEGEACRGAVVVVVAVAVAVGGRERRAAEGGQDHPVLGVRRDLDRHVGDGHAREGGLALRHVLLLPHDLDLERPARAQRLAIQEIVQRVVPRRRDPRLGAEGGEHALPVRRVRLRRPARLLAHRGDGRAERAGGGRHRPRPVFEAAVGLLVFLVFLVILVIFAVRLLHLLELVVEDRERTPAALDRLEVRGALRGEEGRPDVLANARLRGEVAATCDDESAVVFRERDVADLVVHDRGVHLGRGSLGDGHPAGGVKRVPPLPHVGREEAVGASAQVHSDGLLSAALRFVKGRASSAPVSSRRWSSPTRAASATRWRCAGRGRRRRRRCAARAGRR